MKGNMMLCLLSFFITLHVYAQPRLNGQKTVNNTGNDILTAMALTSDGGVIAGGTSHWGQIGYYDYLVVKLNRALEVEWQRDFGTYGHNNLQAVQQTPDGGYILGGYSNGNANNDKTEDSRNRRDYWIIKLDANGNKEWDKTIGGNGYDFLEDLQLTKDGGYILGGYSNSSASGEKTGGVRNDYDYWIVKLDAAGNIQWDKTIGGNNSDVLQALQQTKDGGYILGGYSNSNPRREKSAYSRGGYDYWVVKLDKDANIQWEKTIGGNSYDLLEAIQQTKDGGYILGGYSTSGKSGSKSQDSRGSEDYWIVKIDADGNKQWDRTIGGNRGDYLRSLDQTADGGYILGGTSGSDISGDKTNQSRNNNFDEWIVKVDWHGRIQWQKSIGGSIADACNSIIEYAPNRYMVGGTSRSDSTGNKNEDRISKRDFWIYKLVYDDPNSAAIASAQSTGRLQAPAHNSNTAFSFYPNPAREQITVQTTGKAVFTLLNTQGKIVVTQTINGTGVIRVTHLPAGVYYLKNTATGATQKVMVIK